MKEGERTRVQAYEGVCIARTGGGLNESFTVRKISYGEGVERVFPVYSPNIDSIKVVRRGKVRRAKLYYLRDRRGKSARIAEKMERRRQRPRVRSRADVKRRPLQRRPGPTALRAPAEINSAARRPRLGQRRVQDPAMAERIAEGREPRAPEQLVGFVSPLLPS